ncbi:nitrilase-related carbon-nitrogen hydrolase [Serratia sp. M24T3]|uniref:nitrilase-related carbon-nitrogen hydrolase n=1 Tax=Serratia sp. M24T3 TaxID=932213 RepID=UPI00025B9EDA|nr:nitrilase-related carbon-nitrogen hydrolase [Serratia sp. M24T3]EIC86750.1 nitrilase/cyanide hydratase and apolipoprotein N-acyltransferase [Serratia sp. M24T3]
MTLNVAAIQFEPKMFRQEENIAALLKLCEQAAEQGAKLLVMPEMAVSGYCWQSREEVAPYVDTIPGATTRRFAELAARHQCYLVVGMPEVDATTHLYYNSAVLIGPEGVIGTHRKTHPYISEPKWAANGDKGHAVFDTPVGRIAMLICMDIHFVETARLAGVQNAEIICHISNWLAERTPAPYWINRAWENDCYLVESNRWGLERGVQFSGGSCIINPDGSVQSSIDSGNGVVRGEILLQRGEKASRVTQRRPETYLELMNDSFTWNPLDFFGLYQRSPLPVGKQSTVSVGQFQPLNDVQSNLLEIRRLATAARQNGSELMVFPELSLTGAFQHADQALHLDGAELAAVTKLAITLQMTLVIGIIEAAKGNLYNTAVAIGPAGLLGSYRKIHLNQQERTWATAGDHWATVDLPCGRMGLLIGEDLVFPESGRILALRGCDIIACPAALAGPTPGAHAGSISPQNYPIPTGPDAYHWLLPRVRAGENNCYLAYANVYEEGKYQGLSGIFGPDTFAFPRHESLLVESQGDISLTVDTCNLDTPYPTNVVRRKDLVLMRQTHGYLPLIASLPSTQ